MAGGRGGGVGGGGGGMQGEIDERGDNKKGGMAISSECVRDICDFSIRVRRLLVLGGDLDRMIARHADTHLTIVL